MSRSNHPRWRRSRLRLHLPEPGFLAGTDQRAGNLQVVGRRMNHQNIGVRKRDHGLVMIHRKSFDLELARRGIRRGIRRMGTGDTQQLENENQKTD